MSINHQLGCNEHHFDLLTTITHDVDVESLMGTLDFDHESFGYNHTFNDGITTIECVSNNLNDLVVVTDLLT